MTDVPYRLAVTADIPGLLKLQASYYAEDAYPFDEDVLGRVWQAFLDDRGLGNAWVAEVESKPIAYVIMTLGYSLEYRGRDAFVDELYVSPPWRGRGLGRLALQVVDSACIQLGVGALHLEVDRHKPQAQSLYRRSGFTDKGRVLMTKSIGPR